MRSSWLAAAGFSALALIAGCGSPDHGATVPFDSVITGPPPAPALPKLVFEPVQHTVAVGAPMAPIRVDVKDAKSALMDVSDTMVLTIDHNPSQANLGGQTLAAAVHGVATFSGVHFDAAGQGFTLRASAVNRISGISDSITVTP